MIRPVSIDQTISRGFETIADKKGYDNRTKSDFVYDSKQAYKKSAKVNSMASNIILASPFVAALIKAKQGKTSIKEALKTQFKPCIDFMNSTMESSVILNDSNKSVFSAVKEGFKEGFKDSFKGLKAGFLSIPKPIRAVGVALIALSTVKYQLDRKGIETKYDTIQYIKDNDTKCE